MDGYMEIDTVNGVVVTAKPPINDNDDDMWEFNMNDRTWSLVREDVSRPIKCIRVF